MVSAKKSHEQSLIINSLNMEGMRKYYRFLLNGGTVEQFVAQIKKGTIKVERNQGQQGTVTPKFSVAEDED
jgi:hypothetical protein